MTEHKYKNDLASARRRMGFTKKFVASLIHRSVDTVGKYEIGTLMPPLETALQLELIYRMPVAYLYVHLYRELREGLREQEHAILFKAATDHDWEEAL